LLTLPSSQWPRNRTGKRDQVQSPRFLAIAVICHTLLNDMADVYSVVAKQIGACSHTVLLAALSSDRTSAEPWIAPSMAWTLHRLWFLCSAGACHCVSLSTVYASTEQVPWSSLGLRSDSIHMLAPVG
jgi:hypothetical protein